MEHFRIFMLSIALFSSTLAWCQKDTIDLRDAIGDLNASSIKRGEFPGAIQVPGSDISLGFGGFIKTVIYHDSHKEARGEIAPPAFLNPTDRNGQFAMSARLSRFFTDARVPTSKGRIRGYFEYDFTGTGFNLRHAYGSYTQGRTEVLMGQYWSALMDLRALAYLEATAEPAPSGAIFVRQAQLRVTHRFSKSSLLFFSIEDPISNDLAIANYEKRTSLPDLVAGISLAKAGVGHIQIAGVIRRLQADSAKTTSVGAMGYGVSLGSHLDLATNTKLVVTGAYGKGFGRYLLGLNNITGALDGKRALQLLTHYGLAVAVQQPLNTRLRMNAGVGIAGNVGNKQSLSAFRKSTYINTNFFYQITRYLTAGIEYLYGRNAFVSNVQGKNHRVQIGIQVF